MSVDEPLLPAPHLPHPQTHKMTKNDRARFMEEGKMLKILEHRNILGFYDYWEVPEKRKVILVTELMTSGTLKA